MPASMTPRERVLTALRRQPPDRLPKGFSWTPPIGELLRSKIGDRDPLDHFGVETRGVGPSRSNRHADFSSYFVNANLPASATIDEWGMAEIPDSEVHYTTYVYPMVGLGSPDDIATYPWPDVLADYRWQGVPGAVSDLHARGLAVEGGMECTVFERAWYLRSMDLLFTDWVENPAFAEALLDKITAFSCGVAERYARADVDILGLGDDVGMQHGMLMSPGTWRHWLKPRLARVIASAKAVKPDILVRYHSDGNVDAIIPELIEIGVDVLNPVQPECLNPAEMKTKYGDRLAFWGAMGTQTTLPFGSPEEVRRVVRERFETIGQGGGLVLAPTHVVQPDVSWENILAFFAEIDESCVY